MTPLLILILFTVLAVYIYYNKIKVPKNYPPGPTIWPVWGGYLQILLENYRLPYKAIHNMAKRYKTNVIGTYFGNFPTVIACDLETVREVLLRPEFQGRVDAFVVRYRSDGDRLGIIFTEDDLWTEQRRFMMRNMRDFGFGRRSDVFEGKVEYEVKELIEVLKKSDKPFCKDGYARLPELFYVPSFNMAIQVIAGDRHLFNEAYNFTDTMVKQIKNLDATTGAINMTPWVRLVAPGAVGYTVTKYATQFAKKFVQKLINEHKANMTDDTTNDFIDRYLQEIKTKSETQQQSYFSENQLRLIGMDMLLAGTTTVPFMTSFIIYLLAKHQRVQKKCQDEIDEVVGENRLPTLNDRENMPYTEAAIREALRFQTLVPLSVPHKATEDTTLGGYFIPKGALVFTSLYSAHLDEKVWEKPQEYLPERFIDSNGKLNKRDLSLPFGLGKRVCPGETFSRQNIFITVSSLLQNFHFTENPSRPFPDLSENKSGINESPKPFWVKIEPRS